MPLLSWRRSRSDVFARVYKSGDWGKDFAQGDYFSGPGSLPAYTREYEDFVCRFIQERDDIGVVLDIGCGDFQVAKRILDGCHNRVTYIGVDVVAGLVERNLRHFSSPNITFGKLDAVEDPWPNADLVLIREVLQHLSLKSVSKIVSKLTQFRYVLVTEHCAYETSHPNINLPDGPYARVAWGSGTYLDRPPFNLRAMEVLSIKQKDGITCLRTVLIQRTTH
jgi:SAM-dependent methyltransferase